MSEITSLQIGQNKIEMPKVYLDFKNHVNIQLTESGSDSSSLAYYTEAMPYDGYFKLHYVSDNNGTVGSGGRIAINVITSENPLETELIKWFNLNTGEVVGMYVKKGTKLRLILTKFNSTYTLNTILYY